MTKSVVMWSHLHSGILVVVRFQLVFGVSPSPANKSDTVAHIWYLFLHPIPPINLLEIVVYLCATKMNGVMRMMCLFQNLLFQFRIVGHTQTSSIN